MSIDEIKKLNPKERIILMNEIWESFEDENITIESPKWHQEILEERVSKIKNGEAKFYTIDEVKQQFKSFE